MRSSLLPSGSVTCVVAGILIITILVSGCIYDPEKAKVTDVEKDSPAQDHGVKKGMIIRTITYIIENETVKEEIKGCDRISGILKKLAPGDRITLEVDDKSDRREIKNITLGETNEGKAYLGIECGPASGFFLDSVYIFGYILLIVILAVLIFIVSAIEKWVERRKERNGN